MAYVYSKVQSFKDSNTYGNVAMEVNIYRGEVTRTENKVSFKFGVSFKPTQYSTSNSIAAWYDGVQKFAYTNSGYSFESAPVRGKSGVTHHAYYTDRNSTRAYTTANLCYSYSNSDIKATTTSVNVSIGVGWWDWAGSKKGTLTFSLAIPEYHGPIGDGSIYITDNGNNTFTIGGTKGKNGTNNNSSGPYLSYSYDSATYNYKLDDNETSGTFSLAGSTATRTVYAKCVTKATYGSDTVVTTSKTIKRYTAPGAPGTPKISYTKSRLTIKEPWKISWGAASKASNSSDSGIAGYDIYVAICKKGSSTFSYIKGITLNGTVLTKGSGTNTFVRSLGTGCSLTINDPSKFGFAAGDQVQITVNAFVYNGKNEVLQNSNAERSSEAYQINNAGIANVKVNNAWIEGQVWVNVNGTWKEAETVSTKVNGVWKESQ